ncbi:MAG TPA: NAD(P)H-dependent oxidoreductase [Aequorivita sp.]|nr:NAD(P)H-dependent oxidoreductase [Aequorivita sp.]
MNLIETLNWRYATKKFSDKKVSEENLQEIVTAINLSASSAGMQPYRLFVIENSEIRKELGADSFNAQIAEASHLLVFAALSSLTQKTIEDYIAMVANQRNIPAESLMDFKNALESNFVTKTDEETLKWATNQAYIGLGTGMIAAANLKIDATPMEGFNREKFDVVLGLNEKGLKSAVLLALGYRDAEKDVFAKMKKVRLPKEEFAVEVA